MHAGFRLTAVIETGDPMRIAGADQAGSGFRHFGRRGPRSRRPAWSSSRPSRPQHLGPRPEHGSPIAFGAETSRHHHHPASGGLVGEGRSGGRLPNARVAGYQDQAAVPCQRSVQLGANALVVLLAND